MRDVTKTPTYRHVPVQIVPKWWKPPRREIEEVAHRDHSDCVETNESDRGNHYPISDFFALEFECEHGGNEQTDQDDQ